MVTGTMLTSITGAVDALTRALAIELAPIRVNIVAPGAVETEVRRLSSSQTINFSFLFIALGCAACRNEGENVSRYDPQAASQACRRPGGGC